MPAIVRDSRVVIAASAEMDDVLYALPLRGVEEILALAHHVDGVAGGEKRTVDALQRRFDGFNLVEIELNNGNAKVLRLLRIARGCDDFDVGTVLEMLHDKLADLTSGFKNENFGFG
jgi:hypothetical protein